MTRNPIVHHRLLEWLSTRGHEITVIDYDIDWASKGGHALFEPRKEISRVSRYGGVSNVVVVRPAMIRLSLLARLSWLIGNVREIHAIARASTPDVFLGYGISNALLTLLFARYHRRAFIYHILDALHTHATALPVRLAAWVIERVVMSHADAVIVVNEGLRTYALQMGAPRRRIDIVGIGVERLRPDLQATERVRRQLGIGSREVLLIFVGWLYPFSGMRELLLDFARRGSDWPWLRLLVVGGGPIFSDLERIRSENRLESQVILAGQQPSGDVPALIDAADIGLLPAKKDPVMEHLVPTKVIEYLEHHKLVIATGLSGLRAELGTNRSVAFINSPSDVIDVILDLEPGATPEKLREVARERGSAAADFINRREDWATVNMRFEAILNSHSRTRNRLKR